MNHLLYQKHSDATQSRVIRHRIGYFANRVFDLKLPALSGSESPRTPNNLLKSSLSLVKESNTSRLQRTLEHDGVLLGISNCTAKPQEFKNPGLCRHLCKARGRGTLMLPKHLGTELPLRLEETAHHKL